MLSGQPKNVYKPRNESQTHLWLAHHSCFLTTASDRLSYLLQTDRKSRSLPRSVPKDE